MLILVQPVSHEQLDYFFQLQNMLGNGEHVTEAIVFEGSAAELPNCSTFLFNADGSLIAQVNAEQDDRALSALFAEALAETYKRRQPTARRGVAFLPVVPRSRLLIVGGGHVGHAVAKLACELDFDVWVVDDRAEFVTEERFPQAERRIAGKIGDILPALEIDANTFCLIVTRGHNHDEEALFHLAQRGARYVGMIGSKRKIKMIFEDLISEGISPEALASVHAPVGLDIGSQTVPEIAVSIAAELIAERSRGLRRQRSPAPPRQAAARDH
jgi:xanthine dehydrogenase accessory factor